MLHCIYCEKEILEGAASVEHIWPDALGGDYLGDFWKTDQVCKSCNNMSGVFVDGAFVKNPVVAQQRANDDLFYLKPEQPTGLILRPIFIARFKECSVPDGWQADFYVTHRGASIVHLYNDKDRESFRAYAGGDPRKLSKKSKAGYIYVALTTRNVFWIKLSLNSIIKYFKNAKRFAMNFEIEDDEEGFQQPDWTIPEQTEHKSLIDYAFSGDQLDLHQVYDVDAGSRFLCKLALAVGMQIFGNPFLQTAYAKTLRKGFREANFAKRQILNIKGGSLFSPSNLGWPLNKAYLPSAWQIAIMHTEAGLGLLVILPNAQVMQILITDDSSLLSGLDTDFRNGKLWITVPPTRSGMGPISLPDYIAHRSGVLPSTGLKSLEERVCNISKLPDYDTS